MARNNLGSISAPKTASIAERRPYWLWSGFLKPGRITLLTGPVLIGKSTLLAGVLRNLISNRKFLGRCCSAGKALVHSTDQSIFWGWQEQCARIGHHVAIDTPRPYNPPTEIEWEETVEEMIAFRLRGELDLFVVDSIDRQFPEHADRLTVFAPLRRLTAAGAAVLLILDTMNYYDPERSAESQWNVIDSVDFAFELCDFGRNQCYQRQLVRLKGPAFAPARIPYEYDGIAGFTLLDNPESVRFEAFWKVLKPIFAATREPLDLKAIRELWPSSDDCPSAGSLAKQLARATVEKRVIRSGAGRRNDPYRYCVKQPRT